MENAKNKSILDVASECGYSFRKSGKYYIGNEHDSLVLNANKIPIIGILSKNTEIQSISFKMKKV